MIRQLLPALIFFACATAQEIGTLPAILGSAVDKTNDKIIVRDASATASSGNLRLMTVADLVNVPGLFSYEPALGNPASNGYVLSSTTAGVRSWIAPGGTWGSITGTLSGQADLFSAFGPNTVPLSGYAGFWPADITTSVRNRELLISGSPNAVREMSCVYFNGAYRILADEVEPTDPGFDDPPIEAFATFESDIAMWTTTVDPARWDSTSFTRIGNVITKSGSVGHPDRYGATTPSMCVIGTRLWVSYTAMGGALGATPRNVAFAYSDDGVTFTKVWKGTGATDALNFESEDSLDGDTELLHDPRTGRTFLYGTGWRDATRTPRVWYTDNSNLGAATWTEHGDIATGLTGPILPYAVWIDSKTGLFWMSAGQNGPTPFYFSRDGLTWTATSKTLTQAELHSFRITDANGEFAAWATNSGSPTLINVHKKATAADHARFYIPLSDLAGTTANGNFVVSAPRGVYRYITNVRFGFTQSLSADASNYWTFEIRHRNNGGTLNPAQGGPTILGTTAATATSNYAGLAIPGDFLIRDDVALQAYWTKTGTPSGPGYLWLEFTEHP